MLISWDYNTCKCNWFFEIKNSIVIYCHSFVKYNNKNHLPHAYTLFLQKLLVMRLTIYFILFTLIFSACKQNTAVDSKTTPASNDILTLESQVMAIHDEVMPKMGDIHIAKKQLKNLKVDNLDDSLKTKILQLITDLDKSDEGMMQWMSEWNVPQKDPEKTAYLEGEKIKITKVKVDMLSSIEAANEFISKMKK